MIVRSVLRLRWLWVVLTLPPVLLWARAFPYAGLPIVVSHAALVLLHGALHDRNAYRTRDEPRLTLLGPRLEMNPPRLVPAISVLVLVVFGMALTMLLTDPAVAGLTILALGTILLAHRLRSRLGAWRSRLVEVWLPAFALAGPMLVLAWLSRQSQLDAMQAASDPGLPVALPEVITRANQTATLLWCVVVGVFILACHTRDEPHDRCDGLLTTPTVFGPRGASVALALWAGLALLLGAYGNGHRLWTWPVLGSLGIGAMLLAWCCGSGRTDRAVIAWTACAAIAGVCLVGRLTF
ncbi:MAG: hypothetical protein ACKVZJ_07080 [Phycisphaerales bacterium]